MISLIIFLYIVLINGNFNFFNKNSIITSSIICVYNHLYYIPHILMTNKLTVEIFFKLK